MGLISFLVDVPKPPCMQTALIPPKTAPKTIRGSPSIRPSAIAEMANLGSNPLSDLASRIRCPGPASFRLQIPYPLFAFIQRSVTLPPRGNDMMVPHAELTIIQGGAFGHVRRNTIWNLRKQVSWASALQFLASCGKGAGTGRKSPARRHPHGALTVRSRGCFSRPRLLAIEFRISCFIFARLYWGDIDPHDMPMAPQACPFAFAPRSSLFPPPHHVPPPPKTSFRNPRPYEMTDQLCKWA